MLVPYNDQAYLVPCGVIQSRILLLGVYIRVPYPENPTCFADSSVVASVLKSSCCFRANGAVGLQGLGVV